MNWLRLYIKRNCLMINAIEEAIERDGKGKSPVDR